MKDKNVLIVGMGKSGVAAYNALRTLGSKISIQDSKELNREDFPGATCYFSKMPDDFKEFDMIVLSPGVDPELEFVMRAKAEGCEIVGELELAYRLAKGTFVGITGTNGKTTTTTLVGEIFKNAKVNSAVVGNIGFPVITESLRSTDDEWLITEVSSFQLQTTSQFKPKVSAILNLTPDHLNRHHTMEEYGRTKALINKMQDENGYFIINYDDEVCMELCLSKVGKPKAKVAYFSRKKELDFGAYLLGDKLVLKDENGVVTEYVDRHDLKIIGDHNVENALAAIAICHFSGIPKKPIVDTLKVFPGVEHRIEFAGEINGVKYYNDSKGTNVDAAVIALKAIEHDIILIAGGDAKSQEFDELIKNFPGRVKHMVLIGRDAPMIQAAADKYGFKDYTYGRDMEECVKIAHDIAVNGDTVLLSPACASWDMYKNYEIRGDHFKSIVKTL